MCAWCGVPGSDGVTLSFPGGLPGVPPGLFASGAGAIRSAQSLWGRQPVLYTFCRMAPNAAGEQRGRSLPPGPEEKGSGRSQRKCRGILMN